MLRAYSHRSYWPFSQCRRRLHASTRRHESLHHVSCSRLAPPRGASALASGGTLRYASTSVVYNDTDIALHGSVGDYRARGAATAASAASSATPKGQLHTGGQSAERAGSRSTSLVEKPARAPSKKLSRATKTDRKEAGKEKRVTSNKRKRRVRADCDASAGDKCDTEDSPGHENTVSASPTEASSIESGGGVTAAASASSATTQGAKGDDDEDASPRHRGASSPSSLFFSTAVLTDVDRDASAAAVVHRGSIVAFDPVMHYRARTRELFVNPFTGKQTSATGAIARDLAKLGFLRDKQNPLTLRWSAETYMQLFHNTYMKLRGQRQLRSSGKKPPPQCDRRDTDTAGAPPSVVAGAVQSGVAPTMEGGYNAVLSLLFSSSEGSTGDVGSDDVTTDDVLTEMLRSFEGPRAPRWRAEVAQLVRSGDALSALPAEIARRYEDLINAYMPPKLDTTPDPNASEVILTPDQENVAQLALRGYHLYVGGSAGTGKTVLIKAIYRKLSQLGLRVAVTATTGVAAVQLGGCTFHRAFSVPVDDGVILGKPRPWDFNALRAVDALIIDEVSLLSAHTLDAFDMEARMARMSYEPFGGIQMIVCGDFMQLSNHIAADDLPAYKSAAFRHLLLLQLTTPMRHLEGDVLIQFLRQLRRGECDMATVALLDRPIPTDAEQVTYIFPRRRDAKQLNEEKLSELQTAEMVCAPQRGPLELLGAFTHTALITFEAESALPLPPRDEMVAIVRAEVAAALARATAEEFGVARKDGSDAPAPATMAPVVAFQELAEHDVVIMPARTATPAVTLRLRVHVDRTEALARQEASRQAKLLGTHRGGVVPPAPQLRRSPTAYLQSRPNLWADVAERVAAKLRGTVLQLFEQEPPELVPLSVSGALADAADGDVVEGLQPLRLKLGCRVMVNRNLSRTVSNGSVGVVEAFAPPDPRLFPSQAEASTRSLYQRFLSRKLFDQLPVVRLLSGEVVQVPPMPLMLGGTPSTYYYGHEVYSLPLQLGYGFTVHKVQGLTLQGTVVLDCKNFFDCPHLVYVACSRVRSLDQLIVHNLTREMVIVQKSALDFSEGLQEAKDALVLAVPPEVPRASWTTRLHPRIYSL